MYIWWEVGSHIPLVLEEEDYTCPRPLIITKTVQIKGNKTKRERLPSNMWSECETCGPKVIVCFPNEQVNQGYAKILDCNSIKI